MIKLDKVMHALLQEKLMSDSVINGVTQIEFKGSVRNEVTFEGPENQVLIPAGVIYEVENGKCVILGFEAPPAPADHGNRYGGEYHGFRGRTFKGPVVGVSKTYRDGRLVDKKRGTGAEPVVKFHRSITLVSEGGDTITF